MHFAWQTHTTGLLLITHSLDLFFTCLSKPIHNKTDIYQDRKLIHPHMSWHHFIAHNRFDRFFSPLNSLLVGNLCLYSPIPYLSTKSVSNTFYLKPNRKTTENFEFFQRVHACLSQFLQILKCLLFLIVID